jgi:hypothetical protein
LRLVCLGLPDRLLGLVVLQCDVNACVRIVKVC